MSNTIINDIFKVVATNQQVKTLVITGSVSTYYVDGKIVCDYVLTLLGQSNEHKRVQFVSTEVLKDSEHSKMLKYCKEVYMSYFNVSDDCLVCLEHISRI